MKRAIVVAVCLAFCLSMPLTAFAAEPVEYVFEMMPPVSMLDDFEFGFFDVGEFVCPEQIPEGKYQVYIEADGKPLIPPCSIEVIYSWDEDALAYVSSCNLDVPYASVSIYFLLYDLYASHGFTGLGVYAVETEELVPFTDAVLVRLVSVDDSISLTDYVTSDSMDVLLDEVVALFPVVLSVIVGYIAVRKGIWWMQGVLRNS